MTETRSPDSQVFVRAVRADPYLEEDHKDLMLRLYWALTGRSAMDDIDFG